MCPRNFIIPWCLTHRITGAPPSVSVALKIALRACLHGGGGPQVGEVTCGRSPHLSCKRDQIKMTDYMDRRVTSPSWGPHLHVNVNRPLGVRNTMALQYNSLTSAKTYRVFQKFVPIVNCILRKAFNASLGK